MKKPQSGFGTGVFTEIIFTCGLFFFLLVLLYLCQHNFTCRHVRENRAEEIFTVSELSDISLKGEGISKFFTGEFSTG